MIRSISELREQISLAFPAVAFHGKVTNCGCEECSEISTALRSKRWDEIPASFVDETCSPRLLTSEAFAAFVPAYLLRVLDDLSGDSIVLEFTVYSLSPYDWDGDAKKQERKIAHLLRVSKEMSAAQIQVVHNFLSFVSANAGKSEWLEPFISLAVETVWRPA